VAIPPPSGPCQLRGVVTHLATPDAYGRQVFRLETGQVSVEVVTTGAPPPLGEVVAYGRFQALHGRRRRALARRLLSSRFLATRVDLERASVPLGWGDAAKNHARGLIRRAITPRHRPLFHTVLLGDRPALSPALRDAFRRSGTAHLLSLSGLHVGLLAGLVLVLCRLLGLPAGQRRYVVAAALLAYLAVAGPRVPTLRATVAGGVFFLAPHRGDSWNRLSGAGLFVVLWDPAALWDIGLQLSFGTVAGILALSQALKLPFDGPLQALASTVASSVSAFLSATPLLALTLGQLPLAALLVGAPSVALFTGMLGLGLAGVACGSLVPELGLPLLQAADLLARPLIALIEASAAWGLDIKLEQPPPACASLILLSLLALGAVRRERGASHRGLLGVGGFGLLAVMFAAWALPLI